MEIENMTIGQARELASLFGQQGERDVDTVNPFVGKPCVFRGRMFGVYFGRYERTLVLGSVTYAVVRDCRRLQYQEYAGFTMSSVSASGLASGSKLSPAVDTHALKLSDSGDGCEIFVVEDGMAALIWGMPNGA